MAQQENDDKWRDDMRVPLLHQLNVSLFKFACDYLKNSIV
jgi:hypothetical protein